MVETRQENRQVLYAQVWEFPVRISHWLIAGSVIVLGVTGFLIGHPPFSEPTEASQVYSTGTIRYIHFLAAYLLLSAFLLRLYWGIVGNRFARWTGMFPATISRWKGIGREFQDLLWPRGRFRVYTGHSPLANVIYLFTYAGIVFALVSGFTLYAQAQYTPLWRWASGWGLWLFGNNLNNVHYLHHIALWIFACYLVIHLYLVVYTLMVSRTTEIDTMISGGKFVLKEELSQSSK